MADQRHLAHRPDADPQLSTDSPSGSGSGAQLPREQLERLAELVAIGEVPLGQGFSPDDQEQLERRIRQLRRVRLVQFIARQIALDIHARRRGKFAGDFS